MAVKSPKKLVIDGAKQDARAKLSETLSDAAKKETWTRPPLPDDPTPVKDAATARAETMAALQDVAAGRVSGDPYNKLLIGPPPIPAPPGSAVKPSQRVLSPELEAAISTKLTQTLSVPSQAIPGRSLLDLLVNTFHMRVGDLANLIKGARDFSGVTLASKRQGQVSNYAGRTLEGRFMDNHGETWSREWAAAGAAIRELQGMANVKLPDRPMLALEAMWEPLADAGLYAAAPGIPIFVKRLPTVRDAAGELTDGLTLVLDLRGPKHVVKIVGYRTSKLESVVSALSGQTDTDLTRLVENVLTVQGRKLQNAEVSFSDHIVPSLLTERPLTSSELGQVKAAFLKRGLTVSPVEIVAQAEAKAAREIADAALRIAGLATSTK